MANITFNLDTNNQSRVEVKKQIATYCIERDYKYDIDEQREPLISHFKIAIELPDDKLTHEMEVIKVWGDNLNHDLGVRGAQQ